MKAILITVDWKNKRVLSQFFEGDDCLEQAQTWRAAYREDFSGCDWAIVPDEEANLAHNFAYQMTREV